MPSKIKHLHLLIKIIKRQPNISKIGILKALELLDSPTAERTLERDLKTLREEFNLDITYNSDSRGYTLDQNDDYYDRSFEQFAQSIALNGILQDKLTKGMNVWDIVDLDDQAPIMNMAILEELIDYINTRTKITLHYKKFNSDQVKQYLVEPYYIRQVAKRWYLYAIDIQDSDSLKTFGIDRIEKVESTNENYEFKELNIQELSKRSLGVSNFNQAPELVELETNHWQGKYFESLPVHSSQRISYESKDRCLIKLHIPINQEILQLLASQRQSIKVIHPPKLKRDFKAFIENKLKDL